MLDTPMLDNTRPDSAVTAPDTTRDSKKFTPEVRKGLLGLGLGNTLEWYDWMVFGLLAAFIGPQVLPQHRSRSPPRWTLSPSSPSASRSARSAASCSAPWPTGSDDAG